MFPIHVYEFVNIGKYNNTCALQNGVLIVSNHNCKNCNKNKPDQELHLEIVCFFLQCSNQQDTSNFHGSIFFTTTGQLCHYSCWHLNGFLGLTNQIASLWIDKHCKYDFGLNNGKLLLKCCIFLKKIFGKNNIIIVHISYQVYIN